MQVDEFIFVFARAHADDGPPRVFITVDENGVTIAQADIQDTLQFSEPEMTRRHLGQHFQL